MFHVKPPKRTAQAIQAHRIIKKVAKRVLAKKGW